MRLRHIEVFNAIMLTGSVSAAARLTHVTQPAVSRVLAHAEQQLGFALFQRRKGRLQPTPEALTLYPHVERLFAQLDEVQRLADNLRSRGSSGELRVLTALTLTHTVLPQALLRFRVRWPDVAVRIAGVHSAQVVGGLVLHEADVGFLLSAPAHPALVQEPLAEGRLTCVAPRRLLPAAALRRGHVALADLTDRPVIALDVRDPIGLSLSQACRDAGLGLRSDLMVQTYHAALALAHHGLGIALVDSFTARSADLRRVRVLPVEPAVPVSLHALFSASKPASVVARGFVADVRAAATEP